ncbi:MAG TPA: phosphatase PAP2 family protein [Chthoniobacterales bacterium]|nr:phosphatase PAP2 family protein [Chthoniobacterales bacterium]
MNRRQLGYSVLVALVLTLLGIFFFDRPIAAFAQSAGGRKSVVLQEGTHWLEVASGLPIARYFLTYLLLASSALLFVSRNTRTIAWMLLFIAVVQFIARLTAGALKEVFGRLRPFEVIQAGNWDWKFFSGHGSAFPSGHSALFWGLYFPLVFLFPRYRLPLLIIPVFISIARVGVNDHWCSDVIASAGLAALITLFLSWAFRTKSAIGSAPLPEALTDMGPILGPPPAGNP